MIKKINTLYPINIYLGAHVTDNEYNKIFSNNFQELKEKHSDSDGFVVFDKDIDKQASIFIYYDLPILEYGTIIHECYHAANNIWDWINAKHDVDNDEPFAYLLSHLAKESRIFINEIENGNKN